MIRACRLPSNPTPKEIPHDHDIERSDMRVHNRSAHCARVRHDSVPAPRGEGWLVKSYRDVQPSATRPNGRNEQAALKAITAKRTAADVARIRWWATGGPAYRWNEIILDEMQENFVTLPMSARHLALFHTAIDDAVAAAAHSNGSSFGRTRRGAARRTAQLIVAVAACRCGNGRCRGPRLSVSCPRREVLRHGRRGDADAAHRRHGISCRRGRRTHDRRAHCRVGDRARQGRPIRCKVDWQRAAGPWPMAGHQSDRADGWNLAAVGAVVAERIPSGRTAGGRFR